MTVFLCAALAAAPFKMPEPLFGESITDLDAAEAGEVELDATGIAQRPGGIWSGQIEVEWRALPRLGLALEAAVSRGPVASLRPSASFVLLHEAALDAHLMLDGTARLFEDEVETEPGEPALPFAAGLRGGIRRGALTVRAALGAGAGGHSSHAVPLRAQCALLAEGPFGFAGIEADGDFARVHPWVLAPEAVLGTGAVRLGVAVPWQVGEGKVGIAVRLLVEIDAQ